MIILTCKSCGQSFQAKGLNKDVTAVPCPKCWEMIDVQTSINTTQKRSKASHSFFLGFIICLFWSFFAYAVFAYAHLQLDIKKTFKHTDELVSCLLATLQSVETEKREVVHLVDPPIKVVENAEKAQEATDDTEIQNVESDEEDLSTVSYKDRVLDAALQDLVENTDVLYISLRNYANAEKTERFKDNTPYIVEPSVSLANSEFTKLDSMTYHKKYDLSKGEYVYLQVKHTVDMCSYVILLGFFVISMFFVYCIAMLSFKGLLKQLQQKENN